MPRTSHHQRQNRLGLVGLWGLLAACAAACGTKAPAVTGLIATITLPAGADQLEIAVATEDGTVVLEATRRPSDAGAALASPQSVTIYLPDALAGSTVACTVTALAGDRPTGARGTGRAMLVRQRLVPVRIDLVPASQGDGAVGDGGNDGAATDADKSGGDGAQEGGADGPRASGQPCETADECESSLCIDGTCCASPCRGSCVACNLPGKEGTCAPKLSGTPAADCADQGAPSCGFDGTCDGNGVCHQYEAGFACKAAACTTAGTALMPAAACDGQGACTTANTVDCAPYVCDATGVAAACRTTCRAGAADCVSPAVCVNGSCGPKPKKANGAGCTDATDCASDHCADGVCCASACTGACVSCNQAGFLGTCRPVAAAKADPHAVCKDLGAAACGQSGLCNGAGACAVYASGTVCAAGTCSGRMLRGPKHCDGKGACLAAPDVDCLPYRCNAATTSCFTTCTNDAQCAAAPRRNCAQGACQ